jgi:transcriptional regulator with XRE-family HTH domain
MLPYELTDVKTTRYLSIMGTRAIELGVVGRIVAKRVRRIRKRNGLSLQDLSDRLTAGGRPILPSGLNKIEMGTRRVDVDDLFALASALQVMPNDLLYEPHVAPAGFKQEVWDGLLSNLAQASDPNWYERVTHDDLIVGRMHQPEEDTDE